MNHQFNDNCPDHVCIKSLDELEGMGAKDKSILDYDLPKDINETAVIMYTSGTTSNPKAVCISHKSLMANLKLLLSNCTPNMFDEQQNHIYMSYLPLAHILGYSFEMYFFFG